MNAATKIPQIVRRFLPGRADDVLRVRAAFTLMELLIVIAVISVLTTLLLPALAQAKARAKSSRCFSNLRQLAIATQLYVDDHQEALPWSERYWTAPSNQGFDFVDPRAPTFHENFYAQLRAYTGVDQALWCCPSAKEDKSLTVPGDVSPLLGYMGNMYVVGVRVSEWPEARPKRVFELRAPSLARAFTDNGANWQGASSAVTSRSIFSTTPVTPAILHDGGINAALADGAVRHVSRAEFNRPGGPAVPIQDDPKQNWWREGAAEPVP